MFDRPRQGRLKRSKEAKSRARKKRVYQGRRDLLPRVATCKAVNSDSKGRNYMTAWIQNVVSLKPYHVVGYFSTASHCWGMICLIAFALVALVFHQRGHALAESIAEVWSQEAPQRKLFFRLLFVAVMCHFYRLGNFLLSIDDEYAAVRTDASVWIAQGRWTIYWVERLLLPHPTLPFFPDALFCLAMTVAYLLVLRSHRIPAQPILLVLFPLFCAFPSLTVMGEFYANVPSLGLGFVLCAFAVVWSQVIQDVKDRSVYGVGWLLHSLCLAAAIGCYQSFVLVYVVFAAGAMLRSVVSNDTVGLRDMTKSGVVLLLQVVSGAVAYILIQRAHLYTFSSAEIYIQEMMQFDALRRDPLGMLRTIFVDLKHIYTGRARIYGMDMPTYAWTMVIGGVGLCVAGLRTLTWARTVAVWFLTVLLLCVPFAFLLVSGGHLPFRTFSAVPYVVWLFAYYGQEYRHPSLRVLGFVMVLGCVFQTVYINNLYAAQMTLSQQRDRHFATEFYQRLQGSRPDFSPAQHYTVDVFGMLPSYASLFPLDRSSTTAASFFSWDNGNPYRIVYYMNLLGYEHLTPATVAEREQLNDLYAKMPIWPAPGSIVWRGDTVMIRLGESPGAWHHALPALKSSN